MILLAKSIDAAMDALSFLGRLEYPRRKELITVPLNGDGVGYHSIRRSSWGLSYVMVSRCLHTRHAYQRKRHAQFRPDFLCDLCV